MSPLYRTVLIHRAISLIWPVHIAISNSGYTSNTVSLTHQFTLNQTKGSQFGFMIYLLHPFLLILHPRLFVHCVYVSIYYNCSQSDCWKRSDILVAQSPPKERSHWKTLRAILAIGISNSLVIQYTPSISPHRVPSPCPQLMSVSVQTCGYLKTITYTQPSGVLTGSL